VRAKFQGLPVSASLVLNMFVGNFSTTLLLTMTIQFAKGTGVLIGKAPPTLSRGDAVADVNDAIAEPALVEEFQVRAHVAGK
jgi:hypothetical protein